jgi:D-alanyl-D-alanine carboxypeptidase (penicillin-binding protein 5/6)
MRSFLLFSALVLFAGTVYPVSAAEVKQQQTTTKHTVDKTKTKAKAKAKTAAKSTAKAKSKRTTKAAALAAAEPVATDSAAGPADPYPKAAAAYAVAVDDQIIYGRKVDTPRPPASLTKVLSALVILEHHWNPDAPVEISNHASTIDGSRVGLRTGDSVRAGDLLTAMIVRSGNDACMAMAEHVGGSEEGFVKLMNQKAQAIGMASSSFRNPCGLDADGHLSTARDLLTLARVASEQPEISWRANSQNGEFRTLNSNRRISFRSTNAMLRTEPETVGLKTGFTNKAGKCLIALAEHGAHKVWVVLLHSPNRWGTAKQLLARGASHADRPAASLAHP